MIFLLGIVPFWRTGIEGMIGFIDTPVPFDPISSFSSRLYTWRVQEVYGWDGTWDIPCMPYYALQALFMGTGLPVGVGQRIWYILVFSLSGWSMYYLISNILGDKNRRLASLISAMFYMYNPFMAAYHFVPGTVTPIYFTYATLPFILALYIKGLSDERNVLKNFVLIGLASITLAVGKVQQTVLSTYPFLFCLIFFIIWKRNRRDVCYGIKFTVLAGITSFLINSYWILPMIYNMHEIFSTMIGKQVAMLGFGEENFFNILRIYQTYDPFGFGAYYNSTLGIAMSFLIPLITFSALLSKPKNRWVLFFSIISLVYMIGVAGGKSPLGELYTWLIIQTLSMGINLLPTNPWPFWLFLSLSYSPLLGIGVLEVFRKIKGHEFTLKNTNQDLKFICRIHLSRIFLVATCLLILMNSWPILTGNGAGYWIPMDAPPYYYIARDWLRDQPEEFKIFLTPPGHRIYHVKYLWNPSEFAHGDFVHGFFPKPCLYGSPKDPNPINSLPRFIQSCLAENRTEYVGKLLGLMNIKYLMLREDVDPTHGQHINYTSIKEVIKKQHGIHLEESFGKISFYKNEFFSPRILPASAVVAVLGDIDSLIPLTYVDELALNASALFFLKDFSQQDHQKILSVSQSLIIFNDTSVRGPPNGGFEDPDLERHKWLTYGTVNVSTETGNVYSGSKSLHLVTPSPAYGGISRRFSLSTSNLKLVWSHYNIKGSFSIMVKFTDKSVLVYQGEPYPDSESYKVVALPFSSCRWETHAVDLSEDTIRKYGVKKEVHQIFIHLAGSSEVYIDNLNFLTLGCASGITDSVMQKTTDNSSTVPVYLFNAPYSSESVLIHNEGFYQFAVKKPPGYDQGDIGLQINHVYINVSSQDSSWIYFGPFYLEKGLHTIVLHSSKGFQNHLSEPRMLIYRKNKNKTVKDIFSRASSVDVSFSKVNPTNYKVHIKSEIPVFLILNEAYHNKWEAGINGEKAQHFPINLFSANGYVINKTGEYDVEVTFENQKVFYMGSVISTLCLLSLLCMHTCIYIKREKKQNNAF
jgi:hypothetical protein